MAEVTILSAVMGAYDRPKKPVPQTVDTRWLLVTDDLGMDANGWEVMPGPGCVTPRRAAKYPKMRPWQFADTEFVIWIDASIEVTSPEFVAMCQEACPPGRLAVFKHPVRDCINIESAHSLDMPKYKPETETIMKQIVHYARQGHPHHWGLWACGVIAWDHSVTTELLGKRWLDEVDRWSTQDQLSFAYVCRDIGIKPAEFPQNLLDNEWCRVHVHPREHE